MGEMPYPIRPVDKAEFDGFWDVVESAFNLSEPATTRKVAQPLIEFDRTLAAVDGDQFVGTTTACTFTMGIPGGARPVAGISAVGVLPTHRRRGVLSSLMRRQLTELHETGEAIAALHASEATIYGRFGYGCASDELNLSIRRGEAAYVPNAPHDPRLRLRATVPDQARPLLAEVYARQPTDRPGFLPRNDAWWGDILHDPENQRRGFGAAQCVIAEDDDGPRGYAVFAMRPAWTDTHLPDGRLAIRDLFAADPAAYAAVWRHLLDRDLISTVTAIGRPVDDPIQYLLTDPRRLRVGVSDGLWVRLVDVGRALSQRAYATSIDTVVEVDDQLCPWNAGRWRLTGDTTGATCEPTNRPADVTLPVSALGAAFLGAPVLSARAGAGLVRELRPGTLTRLARALAWDPAPWCPMVF